MWPFKKKCKHENLRTTKVLSTKEKAVKCVDCGKDFIQNKLNKSLREV